jgi:hypothetical protein
MFITLALAVSRHDESILVRSNVQHIVTAFINAMPVLSVALHEIIFTELTREFSVCNTAPSTVFMGSKAESSSNATAVVIGCTSSATTNAASLYAQMSKSIDLLLQISLPSHPIGAMIQSSAPSSALNNKMVKAFESLPEPLDRFYVGSPESEGPELEELMDRSPVISPALASLGSPGYPNASSTQERLLSKGARSSPISGLPPRSLAASPPSFSTDGSNAFSSPPVPQPQRLGAAKSISYTSSSRASSPRLAVSEAQATGGHPTPSGPSMESNVIVRAITQFISDCGAFSVLHTQVSALLQETSLQQSLHYQVRPFYSYHSP